MSITLKQKYTLLKRVRANPHISDAGKVLFEYLLIQCHNAKTLKCHPGAATIMKATGWCLRKVRLVLAQLKKAGVLRWKSGREGWSNEYHFPGLVSVTERDIPKNSAELDVQNHAPTGVKSCTHPVSNHAPQHLIEHLIEHCPGKDDRADALPSLKSFDCVEEEERGLAMGSKVPIPVPLKSHFYVRDESPQRRAWDGYGRKNGRSFWPKDKNGGWYFPTEWPPGFEESAIQDNGSGVRPKLATWISEERRKP